MNTRLALLDYCVRHRLDPAAANGLWKLAGFDIPPPRLRFFVRAGLGAASALLIGAGLVCWVAANWSSFGRALQFGMLEGMILLSCIGATFWLKLRIGLSLFAFIAIGALFAYLGQTYQSGADPWQLFALWSALGLPLVLIVHSESLRTAWVVTVMTGIGLWLRTSRPLIVDPSIDAASTIPTLIGCIAALLLAISLSRPLQRYTRAGPYASRVAIVAALGMTSMVALPGIVSGDTWGTSVILVGLILLLAVFYTQHACFDIVALCACALALNFLIDTAIVVTAMNGHDFVAMIFIIGIAACGLCGVSIAAILWVMRLQVREKGNR